MKRPIKFISVIVALIILTATACLTVFAAQQSQDGLEAQIITDKESYTANENIKTSITVKNTNDYEISNLTVTANLPESLKLVDGETTKSQERLKSDETFALEFTSKLNSQTKETSTNPPATQKPANSATNDVVNDNDNNKINNDSASIKTGENSIYLTIFGILFLLTAITLSIVVFKNKNRPNKKKFKGTISLILCLTVIGSSVIGLNVFTAKATETTPNSKSFELSKVIEINNQKFTISATISYEVKQAETTPDNDDIQLTIDQKDFTTTESLQTITGTYNPNSDIQSIKYKIEDFNKIEIEKGTAKIDNGKWSIKEILLVPDKNYITVTAYTSDGKTMSANTVINYNNGYDYDYHDSNIITDKNSGISFVDNIILIYFEDDITEAQKTKIVKSINAELVGRTNALNLFQVKTKKFKSLKEIKQFCDELMNIQGISEATYDLISEIDLNDVSSKTPSDPWSNKNDIQDWNEDQPSGNNWWCEAIKLPSAWTYKDRFNNINIGIADVGFQTDHEDLNVTFPSSDWENNNKLPNSFFDDPSHGTHVAGIIGATANNKKGITGILWNTKLICCDIQPTFGEKLFNNTSSTKRLIQSITSAVEAKAKVINYSWGYNSKASKTELNESAYRVSRVMSILLCRYDFLIVQSAGNLTISAERNGFFCSINKDNCYSGKDSVPYNEIKNRIIVVGAIEKCDNNYRLADFSNYGDNIDITAPGTDIYSTVVNGYGNMTGTSMAAPMVTGVAGLVWSVNPNFTGSEVKEIVCNSVDTSVSSNTSDNLTYKLLNAKLAVEKALVKTDGYIKNECTIKFVDSDTQLTIPAKCTIYKATDEEAQNFEKYKYIDYCETFDIELPNGIYRIDVTPLDEGHEPTSVTFIQDNSGINTQIISINKKVIKPEESDFIYRIENDEVIITGYKGKGGDILIPFYIEEKPVVKIDEHAFYKNNTITSVTFENSIDSIGDFAFDSCTSLTTVKIQGSVIDINNYAFYNCNNLTSFMATDGVYNIGGMAFSGCKKLSEFGIQNKIQTIDGYAFFSCSSLYDFEYPKGADVNKYAFMGTNTQYKNDWVKF